MTAGWTALREELDRWAADGREAEFWWRDDDAVAPTPVLERLLGLSDRHQAPLLLAVIPGRAEAALAGRVSDAPLAAVCQHGYEHRNHAPDGDKKMELGPHRPSEIVIGELAMGWQLMTDRFGPHALPVLVPPWNRIAPHLVPMLPEMRYAGLSAFGPRNRAEPVRGFRQVNAHVDIVDWKGSRGFVGEARALEQAVSHLAAKRAGTADAAEPTGLLTHHLDHDEGCWDFAGAFLAAIRDHPAARWRAAADLFVPGAAP